MIIIIIWCKIILKCRNHVRLLWMWTNREHWTKLPDMISNNLFNWQWMFQAHCVFFIVPNYFYSLTSFLVWVILFQEQRSVIRKRASQSATQKPSSHKRRWMCGKRQIHWNIMEFLMNPSKPIQRKDAVSKSHSWDEKSVATTGVLETNSLFHHNHCNRRI